MPVIFAAAKEKKKGEDGKRGMFFIRYQNQVVYITFNTSFLEL